MQQSTSLSNNAYTGMLLALALINVVEMPDVNLHNLWTPETIKYLSTVNNKAVYMGQVESALISLKENAFIDSFDILLKDTSGITTILINIPKSKDIQKLVNTNMAISEAFANIPESDREEFTTIQQMV